MTALVPVLDGRVEDVAPRLLGAELRLGGVAVRLTEVEAYGAADDPGSHAYRGRTPRNQVMFGPPGHLYCYLSYGMHVCANVVTSAEGSAGAVLLRAGRIVAGLAEARARRPGVADRDLARGPAVLCRALGITLAHDGADLRSGPVTLRLADQRLETVEVSTGPRVGLRGAPDRPWRFWLTGDATVSRYRPAPPGRRSKAT